VIVDKACYGAVVDSTFDRLSIFNTMEPPPLKSPCSFLVDLNYISKRILTIEIVTVEHHQLDMLKTILLAGLFSAWISWHCLRIPKIFNDHLLLSISLLVMWPRQHLLMLDDTRMIK